MAACTWRLLLLAAAAAGAVANTCRVSNDLGCFVDSETRSMSYNAGTDPQMTREKCAAICDAQVSNLVGGRETHREAKKRKKEEERR